MPSPVARHESAIPCPPPTDPTGFIYSSYQAAQTETLTDKPSLNSSHQGVAYVSSSVGGSVSTLSFEETKASNRLSPRKRHGRGTRYRIKGFSRASRRNLLRHLASINRSAFKDFKGRLISITLTYPHEYPEDPEVCKNHLKALRKRLQRKCEDFAGFWRLGIQRRGAWHFHLLLFMGPSIGPVSELRRFISSSWHEITGKVSEGHLRAGTSVDVVKKWKEATSYAERYMAKPEGFPEGLTEVDGARLRRLRRERALSQRDLSRMTGIAFDTISRLETGKQRAQPRTIRKLADALGVEPRELMKED
jgi:DNA-binding Xre family transcriptional regulator